MESIARKIVSRLFDAGFIAYYAGGYVRDLLRGSPSNEIDIATSAPPETIAALFPKTIDVGVAFGVMIVVEEGHMFEVATFRKDHPYHDGRHPDGVDFSTPEKDAQRRDFTINGMFYDPLTQTLYDYVGGESDLKAGILRAIGDPEARFEEDRLRMLRAARFTTRFDLKLDPATEQAIIHHAPTLLPAVSPERIWQELVKMTPYFAKAGALLEHLGLLRVVLPEAEDTAQTLGCFPYYPLDCPTIVYLHQLAPAAGTDLCDRLKTPVAERKLIAFFQASKELLCSSPDAAQWAHFYAHPHAQLFLDVMAAHILPPKRAPFVEEHTVRRHSLNRHIQRLESRRPLLGSQHLKEAGIPPGKLMGELLREGERLAINEDLTTPQDVLSRLQASSLWPK